VTHTVTGNCNRCRYTDCVATCPVECFHADDERVYIDAQVCIDCGACVPACPVHAIYDSFDLPADQKHWIEINHDRVRALPIVTTKQTPLATAQERKRELGY
jgi:ferredoxin